MWPRLLFLLVIVGSPLGCAADDTEGAATGPTTTHDTGPSGACGGEACDPLSHYCMIPVGALGGEEAGTCVALPSECPASDPCPCLLPLCANAVCAESDGGWALLTCNQS